MAIVKRNPIGGTPVTSRNFTPSVPVNPFTPVVPGQTTPIAKSPIGGRPMQPFKKQFGGTTDPKTTRCAMDVKQCPDGSYVGRDPSRGCAFAPCPGEKKYGDEFQKRRPLVRDNVINTPPTLDPTITDSFQSIPGLNQAIGLNQQQFRPVPAPGLDQAFALNQQPTPNNQQLLGILQLLQALFSRGIR